MKRKDSKGSHLGYYDHYVVDGGRARIILNVLVTPFEVTENQPMLDLLWRTSFRYKLRPKQVTGDTAYGTVENIAAVERMGIRAYVPLTGAGKARPYFSKEEFTYDPEQDLYRCPAGQTLRRFSYSATRRLTKYKADPATCAACWLRPQCTKSKRGREVLRYYDEDYVDRVKSYFGTFAYQKALPKRKVWVEPMFGEAKDWHGLRRFRLRRLVKVNIEALLIAAGQNVKRLLTFGGRSPKALAQVAALRPPDSSADSGLHHVRKHHAGSSWRSARPFLNRPTSLGGDRISRELRHVCVKRPLGRSISYASALIVRPGLSECPAQVFMRRALVSTFYISSNLQC
jgi:hypothetical protein